MMNWIEGIDFMVGNIFLEEQEATDGGQSIWLHFMAL
jgi:hypothetical protein